MSQLLSQGGFGCVYYPGINCKGEKNENKKNVTKIQKFDFNAENEIYIGNKIKKIMNYNLYFLPVISSCPIDLAYIKSASLIDCEVISRNKGLDFIIMDIPYIVNTSFFSFLTDFHKNKKHILINLIETYSYLLNSIQHLVDNKIVHYDLKSENILYNTNTNNPIIIDFGISIPIHKLTQSSLREYFYIFAPDYYIWPLEVHLINFMLHENINSSLSETNIQYICKQFIEHNKALELFSSEFKKKYENLCIESLTSYLGYTSDNIMSIIESSYQTWDNYSLSVLYLRILQIMFNKGFVENKLIIYFSQLLLENINPYSNKRYSVKETMNKYKDIFFIDDNPTNYLSFIENFNYDRELITKKISEDIKSLPKIKRKIMKPKSNPERNDEK